MKPPLASTLTPSRRGSPSLAGRLGGYDGEWREGLSLIMRSAGNDHSKPCYGPAMMKESARIKHRRGIRHSPLAGSQYQEQVFFWLRPPRRASATDRLSASTADSLTARACYIAGLFPAHRLHRVSGLRASDYHALALTRPKFASSPVPLWISASKLVSRKTKPTPILAMWVSTALAGFPSRQCFARAASIGCDLRATYPDWREVCKKNL